MPGARVGERGGSGQRGGAWSDQDADDDADPRGRSGRPRALGEPGALGRIGEPADLVGMFVYLASDASAWVTGQVFYVEGGWLLS